MGPITIDSLRAMIGPLPRTICQINIAMKNIVQVNVSLLALSMTMTKFAFLCIYKSIPMMDDNFLSTFGYILINLISILATVLKFYMPGRPPLNELICTGCFYEEWINEKPPMADTGIIISFVCIVMHFILSIPIWIAKVKMNRKEPVSKGTTFGSFLSSWIILGIGIIICITLAMMNKTYPVDLNVYPFNLLVLNLHLFLPIAVCLTLNFTFYYRNKSLHKYFVPCLFSNNEEIFELVA